MVLPIGSESLDVVETVPAMSCTSTSPILDWLPAAYDGAGASRERVQGKGTRSDSEKVRSQHNKSQPFQQQHGFAAFSPFVVQAENVGFFSALMVEGIAASSCPWCPVYADVFLAFLALRSRFDSAPLPAVSRACGRVHDGAGASRCR